MKTHFLTFLFLAITLAGCKSSLYNRTWIPVFVEEDEERIIIHTGAYGIGLKFINDTTLEYHNFKNNYQMQVPIRFTSDNGFKIINKENRYFEHRILSQSKDSLKFNTSPQLIVAVTFLLITFLYPFQGFLLQKTN